jgi:hypothetical protein
MGHTANLEGSGPSLSCSSLLYRTLLYFARAMAQLLIWRGNDTIVKSSGGVGRVMESGKVMASRGNSKPMAHHQRPAPPGAPLPAPPTPPGLPTPCAPSDPLSAPPASVTTQRLGGAPHAPLVPPPPALLW